MKPLPATSRLGNVRRDSHASYLVVFGSRDTPRAVLFDASGRLMAEMIDAEPYVIDGLAESGSACEMPCPSMLDKLGELDRSGQPAFRCYALREAPVRRERAEVSAQ